MTGCSIFAAPSDEDYHGLGQNQEGILDYRGRTLDGRHSYDAPAGATVCVPFLVTNKGYGVVRDNPSATVISPSAHGRTVWQSNVGERVSYFVIAGNTRDDLYAGYHKLTGSPLPPAIDGAGQPCSEPVFAHSGERDPLSGVAR